MGIPLFSSERGEPGPRERVVLGEPNPRRFTVTGATLTREHTIAFVHFPGCTTFEGRKLLVYRSDVFDRVVRAGVMDPHFLEKGDCPLARFAPTPEGFEAAAAMVAALESR
jgi:hypothetical protein